MFNYLSLFGGERKEKLFHSLLFALKAHEYLLELIKVTIRELRLIITTFWPETENIGDNSLFVVKTQSHDTTPEHGFKNALFLEFKPF